MGSTSMQCSASGLGITGGTPVRCLLVTRSPYGDSEPRRSWIVRTPPIRAVNNDYGSICDIHPDDKRIAELWLRGLREDAVEKGLGDNSYHDVPVSRDMSFDELLVAIQERRLEVIQDVRNFWSRPRRAADDDGTDWTPPLMKRVTELLEAAQPGCVSRGAADDKYVVDEPVPGMARVRFGQYSFAKWQEPFERASTCLMEAGLACVVTAGTGRYANLLVFPKPRVEGQDYVHGPQWDMARGASADDDKTLDIGLVMIREDVWQAMLAFPHNEYVSDRYPKTLEYPHKLEKIEYGAHAWHGLDAFKFSVRKAWAGIRADLLKEPREDKDFSPEDNQRLNEMIEESRKAEAARLEAMTPEERATYDTECAEGLARWQAEQQRKKDHPFFGDFRVTSMHHDQTRDLPGAWSLIDSVPGVIGIGDHFSMLLADKVEAWDGLLDAVAELAAVRGVLGGVGIVLRPSESTGPQCPEWGESMRFASMVLDVATAAGERYDYIAKAPATLDAAGTLTADEAPKAPPKAKPRKTKRAQKKPAKVAKPAKKSATKKPTKRR